MRLTCLMAPAACSETLAEASLPTHQPARTQRRAAGEAGHAAGLATSRARGRPARFRDPRDGGKGDDAACQSPIRRPSAPYHNAGTRHVRSARAYRLAVTPSPTEEVAPPPNPAHPRPGLEGTPDRVRTSNICPAHPSTPGSRRPVSAFLTSRGAICSKWV
ncbi:hypothetical protein NDU88_002223 [Pleurodeles waltl]|uniref:Uncharacterized protein n=1 Tax=Pleurodeles waltl TaxID=8319 RepID=A0AAV7VAL1_PLEWA|nr:hypothetical protein NDU88_002223 [Pleurodeles waltl]